MIEEIKKAREELSRKMTEKLENAGPIKRGRIRYHTDRFTEYAL